MTSISEFATKQNPIENLKAVARWAFPHWLLWIAVIAVFALNSLWLAIDPRISMEPQWFTGNLILCLLGFAAMIFRNFKQTSFDWFLHRLWALLMCTLMSAVLMRDLQVLSHLVLSVNLPMADDRLMSWDRALGFDWLAYAKMMTATPLSNTIFFTAYNELTFAGLGFVAALIIMLNLRVRAIEIIYLVVVTAIICIFISSAFSAQGTLALLVDSELQSRLPISNLHSQAEQIAALRGSDQVVMTASNMEGLISFPSFHTCMALIIAWCCRGRWYTVAMGGTVGALIIAGTPIYGGHYLVDVIGGVCVTGFAIWFWRSYIESKVSPSFADANSQNFALPAWIGIWPIRFNSK